MSGAETAVMATFCDVATVGDKFQMSPHVADVAKVVNIMRRKGLS
jgi:hypothetical protein